MIFYDPTVTTAQTQAIEAALVASFPQYAWQLRNQVTMHHHSPETAPYQSARDAMAKFPETCTAIGARLKANHELELFVPYGLEDVCHFLVRPTPHYQANPARRQVYAERLAKKNWQAKWPRLYHFNG